jgi:3-oxoacyl-[acyl-carrier protein] reductase
MVPVDLAPHMRQKLIQPDIMVLPLLWLVSDEASEVTGSRFTANLWDPALPPEQSAKKACTTAGWGL